MLSVYRGLGFALTLLLLVGWFSAFSHMQLLYVQKCLLYFFFFCIEQPPSLCIQGITNGKYCSFLKILIQTGSKIWFYLSHWDDDIFLSHSFLSKWCFNILLWQKRENKLPENLLLTSWQTPTERKPGWKAHCGFLELQKEGWTWDCWVTEGVYCMLGIWGWGRCLY